MIASVTGTFTVVPPATIAMLPAYEPALSPDALTVTVRVADVVELTFPLVGATDSQVLLEEEVEAEAVKLAAAPVFVSAMVWDKIGALPMIWVKVSELGVTPIVPGETMNVTATLMVELPAVIVMVSAYGVVDGVSPDGLTETVSVALEDELTVPLVGVTLNQVAADPWVTVKLVAVALVLLKSMVWDAGKPAPAA